MNFLKVANLSQLSLELNGRVVPVTELQLNDSDTEIYIRDKRAGRLKLSLIKNHNGVLLLRVIDEPYTHIVYCLRMRCKTETYKANPFSRDQTNERCEIIING